MKYISHGYLCPSGHLLILTLPSLVDLRFRASTDIDRLRSNIPRSRSAQSLKNADQGGTEDKLTIVAQMFWIAVSLLESDYEYEFLLAVQLLQRVSKLIMVCFILSSFEIPDHFIIYMLLRHIRYLAEQCFKSFFLYLHLDSSAYSAREI